MNANGNDRSLRILDCTLRDGGYYNDWDFPTPLVERYLQVMADSGVDLVELGFRFDKAERFLGPYAYTTDKWLKHLAIPQGMTLGVMCNAIDLIRTGNPESVVHRMFSPSAESPVDLVRIAAHFSEVEGCEPAIHALHDLGYRVGFNLMQVGGKTPAEISEKAHRVADWPIEVLYFADSFGNMQPHEVKATYEALSAGWPGDIGFHSHDNMSNALGNTMAAFEAGARWLDATVLGMGRGAGNVRLEYLLLELARYGYRHANLDSLLDLIVGEFGGLHRHHRWGPNIFYHLSALYGVHPTYVQEMLSEDRYSHDQVITALQRLGNLGASGYSKARLHEAMDGKFIDCDGTWLPDGWLGGRDLLVVGPGDNGHRHLEGLLQYIDLNNPFIICLNSNPWFPSDKVDAWAGCNLQRLLLDRDYYQQRKGRLVFPAAMIPDEVQSALINWELLDYGVHVKPDSFDVSESSAVIPRPLSALYVLALAECAGANRVFLAGLDGYGPQDPRQLELEDGLARYLSRDSALSVVALTPTTLSVAQSSLYAP